MATDASTLERDTMALEERCRRVDIPLTVDYELARKNLRPITAIKAGWQRWFSRLAFDSPMLGQHGDPAGDHGPGRFYHA